jgi:hypothetical protein
MMELCSKGPSRLRFRSRRPLGQIDRDNSDDPQYRSGTIVWKDASGAEVRVPLKLKSRGKSRRADDGLSYCRICRDVQVKGAQPLHAADAPDSHQICVRKFAACQVRG